MWLPYAAARVTAMIAADVYGVPRSVWKKLRTIMSSRQTAPRKSVGSTGHIAAARAGAAGRRRLNAISLGVEKARPAMRSVRTTGDNRAASHRPL